MNVIAHKVAFMCFDKRMRSGEGKKYFVVVVILMS